MAGTPHLPILQELATLRPGSRVLPASSSLLTICVLGARGTCWVPWDHISDPSEWCPVIAFCSEGALGPG